MRSAGEQLIDEGVTVMFAVTVNVLDVVELPTPLIVAMYLRARTEDDT